ncbi:MAG TPA: alpha/beta hydrolase [Bacteroidales bacterium]
MARNYIEHVFNLRDDYEGEVVATLIIKKNELPSKKAILYVHGFVDYFFQDELADWANKIGFNFYALDLRKHGRSLLPYQSPNHFRNHTEFFEEIDLAVDYIKNFDKNEKLVLLGHSTGGLIVPLYLNHCDKNLVDALILNSPFFDFPVNEIIKIVLPAIGFFGKIAPETKTPAKIADGYAKSVHKDYKGEWDFDLKLKPIEGFPITLGWIRGIMLAQNEIKKGLNIQCPVLVMHSSKSVKPGKYNPSMQEADSILNIQDIIKYSGKLGKNVKRVEIENGMHDLILSKKETREKVYWEMEEFIQRSV